MLTEAPWIHGLNFPAIMEAGASTGLRARAQTAQETEAGDRLRLAYDQLAENERRSMMEMQSRKELAQASMALRAQQANAMDAYRQGSLAARAEAEQRQRENMGRLASQFAERQAGQQANQERLTEQGQAGLDLRQKAEAFKEKQVTGKTEESADTKRLSYLKEKAKLATNLANLDPGTPEYLSTKEALSGIEDFLKKTTPKPAGGAKGSRVRVTSPAGKTGTVPAERLQEYLDAGYTQ